MVRVLLLVALLAAAPAVAPLPARADTLIAARTIPPRTVLTAADLSSISAEVPGALSATDKAAGLEARVVLYAGRPIRPGDLGPPALVKRNQIVALAYHSGGLLIRAEGRALGRAGLGESIRVMNIASRSTVSGVVGADGIVNVGTMQ